MVVEFVVVCEGEYFSCCDWCIFNMVDGMMVVDCFFFEYKLYCLIECGWIVVGVEGWILIDEGCLVKECFGVLVDGICVKVFDVVFDEDMVIMFVLFEKIVCVFGWDEEMLFFCGCGYCFGGCGYGYEYGYGFLGGFDYGCGFGYGCDFGYGCGYGYGCEYGWGYGFYGGYYCVEWLVLYVFECGFDVGFSCGCDV